MSVIICIFPVHINEFSGRWTNFLHILYSISSLLPHSFVTKSGCQYLPSKLFLTCPFLGAFTKLRKATTGFVCPSVRLLAQNNLAPTVWIFMKFVFIIFWKSLYKIQVALKSDKNNGYYTRRPKHVFLTTFHK